MKTLAVGEFKAHFSEVLDEVKKGHPVAIGYGKQKKKVAVILSYDQYMKPAKRKLGILEEKAEYKISKDFKITDEDLLES
jgi:prevent-host-death family protein